MSIFRHTLIYRVDREKLKILMVKHDSRHPGYGGSCS